MNTATPLKSTKAWHYILVMGLAAIASIASLVMEGRPLSSGYIIGQSLVLWVVPTIMLTLGKHPVVAYIILGVLLLLFLLGHPTFMKMRMDV